jgi:energy-coupling factor transporter transmembrane protein EcfT
MDFQQYLVAGVPLVFVVLGLVEFVKRLGLKGNWLIVVSMLIGAALGIGYQCTVAVPVGFNGWFSVSVFGLAVGLVASGIYDAVKNAARPL